MNMIVGFIQLLFWACVGAVAVLSAGMALIFGVLAAIGYLVFFLITGGFKQTDIKH